MVIPDMPLVLEKLGGREYIWLIIPSFAIFALIMRPLSGKMTDTNGRVFVMIIGAVITTLSGLFYLIVPMVSLLFAVRAFHGISAGFTPTGFTAYADDIVPLHKRGEAMGIIGICNNIGNAMGWVIGSQFTKSFGLEAMFLFSSFLGLVSIVIFSFLKESIKDKKRINIQLLKFNRHDLIEKRVLLPSFIFLLTCFSSGAILALIGDFSTYLNINNKGLYMAVYIGSSLFIRFMAGRWSDRYGRQKIAMLGCLLLFFSMLTLALANHLDLYLISSVLFGVAFGLLSPSIFAWAVDISLPGLKGKAVGTLFIFMELGIILGSAIGGILYNNNSENFAKIFILCGGLSLIPILIIVINKKSKNRSYNIAKSGLN
jgi:MFS family permease